MFVDDVIKQHSTALLSFLRSFLCLILYSFLISTSVCPCFPSFLTLSKPVLPRSLSPSFLCSYLLFLLYFVPVLSLATFLPPIISSFLLPPSIPEFCLPNFPQLPSPPSPHLSPLPPLFSSPTDRCGGLNWQKGGEWSVKQRRQAAGGGGEAARGGA